MPSLLPTLQITFRIVTDPRSYFGVADNPISHIVATDIQFVAGFNVFNYAVYAHANFHTFLFPKNRTTDYQYIRLKKSAVLLRNERS
jgi:hypothetical protein